MSDVQQQIDELVKGNRVVLFMKGNRSMPQCGFSGRVVQARAPFEEVARTCQTAVAGRLSDSSSFAHLFSSIRRFSGLNRSMNRTPSGSAVFMS